MSHAPSDGLPDHPDELALLGISAAIAVTATQPSAADLGMALGIATRTQPRLLDVWRRVPGERPVWIIERSDGGGGYRSGSPPDGEPIGPHYVLHDANPATRVLQAVNERLAQLPGEVDPVLAQHVSNAATTCSPDFAERWLRSTFADPPAGPSRPAEAWPTIVERAMTDFGQFSTIGSAASVVLLGAVLGDALGQGPLAAGALGMLQSRAIARWGIEPFDVGHAVWPMISYVASRGGYDAIETTVEQLLAAGERTKETALDSTTTIDFGFRLRMAALEYKAAALGSMAMLDADDGSTVTDSFRRSATVADERVATIGTAIGRWALGYDGSEFSFDQARVAGIRAEVGDRAAQRFAERLVERMWFHPRAALALLLDGPPHDAPDV